MPRHCSLSHEFTQLQQALRGAEKLCAELSLREMDFEQQKQLARSLSATIGLVELRMELLLRVLRKELDPSHALAPWNSVPAKASEHDDPDFRLVPWTLDEQIRFTRDKLERLSRRKAHEQQERKR